jgi:hypothetical protein
MGKRHCKALTAAIALHIALIIDLNGVALDDCSENMEQFVKSRFGPKVEAAMQC